MIYTPTEFIDTCNQSLEYAYSNITIEGEIASFKINQGKWVFFDVKDEESSISCFMTLYQMRLPLEDGMKVRLLGSPKLTKWGKFSFTIKKVVPVGEGNLKKSFELLKKKLEKEGLFAPERKRPLPENLQTIGVISSTQAAGYADFIKILNERWGGFKVKVAHTQVQGLDAPDQIIRALNFLNEQGSVQVIAILRGGGSADDLSVFNDEQLVRAIARSKVPVITGIGHEVDESLADLAADLRASTPSNAAQLLTPDRHAEISSLRLEVSRLAAVLKDRLQTEASSIRSDIASISSNLLSSVSTERSAIDSSLSSIKSALNLKVSSAIDKIQSQIKLIDSLNPERVLSQGYALVTGQLAKGNVVKITTHTQTAQAEIKLVKRRTHAK